MGILKKNVNEDYKQYYPFQIRVLELLDEYNYEILDLRYLEDIEQIVATLNGVVLFITQSEVSISFEVSHLPEDVSNFILILAEHVNPKYIHVTDSFTITQDTKGQNIAIFGKDAKIIQTKDLIKEIYNPKYLAILANPNIKFYNC